MFTLVVLSIVTGFNGRPIMQVQNVQVFDQAPSPSVNAQRCQDAAHLLETSGVIGQSVVRCLTVR